MDLKNLSWLERIRKGKWEIIDFFFSDKFEPYLLLFRKVLHSTYIHVAVMVLVLLDSLLVTAEVIIDAENKNENEDAKVKLVFLNKIFF